MTAHERTSATSIAAKTRPRDHDSRRVRFRRAAQVAGRTVAARSAMIVSCDAFGCDRVIIPIATADDTSSRAEARSFAREHGWSTADTSSSYTDLCPTHAATPRVG